MDIPPFILAIIGIMLLLYLKINGKFDFSYKKHKKAFDDYHVYILTGKKNYTSYVKDFINGNQDLLSGEQEQYISIGALNKRNEDLNSLFKLLVSGKNIVDKYFSKDTFTYQNDYKELTNEWNRFEEKLSINNGELDLSDMLNMENDKKMILLDKMRDYLKLGAKGKHVAIMILAIEKNGYIPYKKSYKDLYRAIKTEFGTDIGSPQSIQYYISSPKKTIKEEELEDKVNYFKVD